MYNELNVYFKYFSELSALQVYDALFKHVLAALKIQ